MERQLIAKGASDAVILIVKNAYVSAQDAIAQLEEDHKRLEDKKKTINARTPVVPKWLLEDVLVPQKVCNRFM